MVRNGEIGVSIRLSPEQLASLYNLLKAEADWEGHLPENLEILRQELKEKAKALSLAFREGYIYPR